MAENKKSFVLYSDQKEIFDLLPLDKRGELISIIFEYVNDENPEVKDPLINMAFTLIKQVLKRDLKKYEKKREQYSEAGKRSAEARRLKKERNPTNSTNVNERSKRSTNSTVNVNDNVSVNVNVNVNEINSLIKNEILSSGIWIETQCKTHKSLELENFKDTFELFWSQNYAGHILENTAKQQNDIKRHFSNTIKKLNNEPTNKKSYVEQLTDKI